MAENLRNELLVVVPEIPLPYHGIASGPRAVARESRASYGVDLVHHISGSSLIGIVLTVGTGLANRPYQQINGLAEVDVGLYQGVKLRPIVLSPRRAGAVVHHRPQQWRVDSID